MNILILDDDINVGKSLRNEINMIYPDFKIIVYSDTQQFLKNIINQNNCIIFLDIFLQNNSGIILSNEISKKINRNIPIIFYSGMPKESFDVYEGKHIYFLEKPFSIDKIKKAIEIAISYLNEAFFEYSFSKLKHSIPINTICYFESQARCVKILTSTDTRIFYEKLDDVGAKLPYPFIRASKSFLVNPLFVSKIIDNKIYLKNVPNLEASTEINISKSYKKKVYENDLFTKLI